MLKTPFGKLVVSREGKAVTYEVKSLEKTKSCSQVNGRYAVLVATKIGETVRCEMDQHFAELEIESGENLEALSFYEGDVKLTIGTEADFSVQQGRYTNRGIEIIATGPIRFGVSWITPVNEVNDVQTWYGADLFGE